MDIQRWALIILVVLVVIGALWVWGPSFQSLTKSAAKSATKSPKTPAPEIADESEITDPIESTDPMDDFTEPTPIRPRLYNEERCRKIFEEYYGLPFPTVRPNFLRNPWVKRGPGNRGLQLNSKSGPQHNLELDGYNHQLRLAFEYQGEQHYNFPNAFHQTEDDFWYQIAKDKYKRKRCQDLSIILIIIPHTVKDHLEDWLISRLDRLE